MKMCGGYVNVKWCGSVLGSNIMQNQGWKRKYILEIK